MIEATNIVAGYGGDPVLLDVNLVAGDGRVVGLIGPNGSGKTTLLRTLYRSLIPTAGTVSLDRIPLKRFTTSAVSRRIAVVAQEGPAELPFTVAEMVLLGRSPHRSALATYTRDDSEIAATALARVGARHLARRSFGALSGGEKQRVAIARAIAQQTDHLLLDEPTNHLDIGYQHEILALVRSLQTTAVVVLHDLNLAARYCDDLILLDRGRVVRVGTPHDVLTSKILEPIYRVKVRRLEDRGFVELLFSPTNSVLSD